MGQKTDAIIDAISPTSSSVTGQNLHYDNLREALSHFGFIMALKKSGEVLINRRKFPSVATIEHDFYVAYLLNASYRLQRSRTGVGKFFWTQQFSASSIKLFGRPDNKVVASLAAAELAFFELVTNGLDGQRSFSEPLLVMYRGLAKSGQSDLKVEQLYKSTFDEIHAYMIEHYADVLGVFDDYEHTYVLQPDDLFKSFSRALELLKQRDTAWEKWSVVMTKNGNLSVSTRYRRICIGDRRVPVLSNEARGLFAHEVLIHALRAVNGEKISKDFRRGLNDYLTSEEGLGVLVESAINNSLAYRVKDRYLDIALALGSYRRRALSREELFTIVFIRSVLRNIADESAESIDDIEKASWQHVNRLYRGTLGNKYIGVFTKDIAYYEGFVKMSHYVSNQLRNKPINQIMEYMLKGKFDPTNKKHRKMLESFGQSKKF